LLRVSYTHTSKEPPVTLGAPTPWPELAEAIISPVDPIFTNPLYGLSSGRLSRLSTLGAKLNRVVTGCSTVAEPTSIF
jgi:hypothetical protein